MWLKIVELSVRNLMLNKLRSLLTMLGTILGVSSVIAMLAIGEGSKRKAVEQIRQLGAANVIVRSVKPGEDDRRDASAGSSSQRQVSRVAEYGLKYADFDVLQATLPTVRRAVPVAMATSTPTMLWRLKTTSVVTRLPSVALIQPTTRAISTKTR